MEAARRHTQQTFGSVVIVRRDHIRPFADQPRKYFDQSALNDLARSIKAIGQQVPIIIRRLESGSHEYELVEGQRRWLACGMAGVPTLIAWIREDIRNTEDQFLASVIANFSREGHTPVEIARAIDRIKKRADIKDLSRMQQVERIGEIFGRSTTWVFQHESLLRLDPKVHELMHPSLPEKKRISFQVALLLVPLPHEIQETLAKEISERRLRTSNARFLIRSTVKELNFDGGDKRRPAKDFNILAGFLDRLEDNIENILVMATKNRERMFASRTDHDRQNMQGIITRCLVRLNELRKVLGHS